MMKRETREYIDDGYILVTANKHLSRRLANQYGLDQLQAGKVSWEKPDILHWRTWLLRLWEQTIFAHNPNVQLLNLYQQQTIWQQIISQSNHSKYILQHANVVRHAVEAWSLLQQWQLPVFSQDNYLTDDARAFASWIETYQSRCRQEGWIDNDSLTAYISGFLQESKISIENKYALIGFDEITPVQNKLFKSLIDAGSEVVEINPPENNKKTLCHEFTDGVAEMNAAAYWSRNILESKPDSTIGIVVPNLQTVRGQIARIFDDVFYPDALLRPPDCDQKAFNISIGKKLIDYPLIDTAFLLLMLARKTLPVEDISRLLRSPFIRGFDDEQIARACTDVSIRGFGEEEFPIKTLLNIIGNDNDARTQCAIFQDCLQQTANCIREFSKQQSPRQWVTGFTKLLNIFGWPGQRTLNSDEYQTVQTWKEVLGHFVSLESVTSKIDYATALTQLRQLVAEFSYQPETTETPVQILGMTGAAEMEYDYLWILGLHELQWPSQVAPNPFIPASLQRNYGLPYATAEICLSHARKITKKLVQSATEVVLSYPGNEADRPLRPSPLLKDYMHSDDKPVPKPDYSLLIYQSAKLEMFSDDIAPAIIPGTKVDGGVSIFKDQAACPFRSFARHRLYAESLPSLDIGLSAIDRGIIVHHTMQTIWERLQTQQALLEKNDSELTQIVKSCTKQAIERYRKFRPYTFTHRFTTIEQQRIFTTVKAWLDLEKQRAPFSVQASESKQTFHINDLEINARIDRIDELDDGRRMIIDYKTGKVNISDWFHERPDDPQLLVYAIIGKKQLAAVLYAQIKRGELAYLGLSQEADLVPGVPVYSDTRIGKEYKSWGDIFNQWQDVIHKLAKDFCMGNAYVDPKNAKSCRYCDLHTFCRINELQDTSSPNNNE